MKLKMVNMYQKLYLLMQINQFKKRRYMLNKMYIYLLK